MMTRLARILLLAAGLALVGCASGPKLGDPQAKPPALSADQGRVYFYREALLGFGSAIQADIKLNGQTVGRCTPNGVFFIDLPPGDYHVSITAVGEPTVNFTLAAGEEKYVHCYLIPTFLTPGILLVGLVDSTKGREAIRDLAYTGQKLD